MYLCRHGATHRVQAAYRLGSVCFVASRSAGSSQHVRRTRVRAKDELRTSDYRLSGEPQSTRWRKEGSLNSTSSGDADRPRYLLRGMIFGTLALVSGLYFGKMYASLSNEEWIEGLDVLQDEPTTQVYNKIADTFDDEVSSTELLTGISTLRKKITAKCAGDVLEVAVGTGRNAEYYSLQNCRSITMLDESGPMLDIARSKWAERTSKGIHAAWREDVPPENAKVHFYQLDAASEIPLPKETGAKQDEDNRGFTTILSTFSLCSMPRPAATLAHLCTLLAPSAPGDPAPRRVLLLEHGKSYFEWLNTALLDKSAYGHAKRFGCWWNRDIGAIVQDAADAAGMEVVEIKRKWLDLGTTWIIELRPAKEWRRQRELLRQARMYDTSEAQSKPDQPSRRRWWTW